MNKFIVSAAAATVFGALAFGATASAQAAPAAAAAQPTHATMTAAHLAKPEAKTAHAVPAPGSRNCLRSTGSLIPAPKGQCLPVAGNTYSQQDLLRTGQMNVGRALQMLDPSVTVNGH